MNSAQWLQILVAIPSVNPQFAPEGSDYACERRIAEELLRALEQVGASSVESFQVEPQRPNVYAVFTGRDTSQWIGVDVHTDTVGISGMTIEPFGAQLQDGKIFGRGAVDTKASLGIMLALFEAANREGKKPRCNVAVVATVGEENGGIGAAALNSWAKDKGICFDQLIVAEPTMCAPVFAHNGVLRATIAVSGRRAHSSQPAEGENAVEFAAKIVLAFSEEQQRLQLGPKGVTGLPQLTVTKCIGGGEPNSVPEQCQVSFDRRLLPTEDPETVKNQLLALAARACGREVQLVGPVRQLPGLSTSPDSLLVRQFEQLSGFSATTAPYATNALSYQPQLAREVVVFGPGNIEQAHTADEWISTAELDRAEGIYRQWLEFS